MPTDTKTESAASKANRTEPFNWNAIPVEDTEKPPARRSSRRPENNPALKHVQDSWDRRDKDTGIGWGKKIVVPADRVTEYSNLIRYATNYLTEVTGERIGSTIVPEKPDKNGMVLINYAAKKRRAASANNGASSS